MCVKNFLTEPLNFFKPLTPLNLRAGEEKIFYTCAVSPAEFWNRVGKALEAKRGYRPLPNEYEEPTRNTAVSIESGRPGTIKKLHQYADWLGVALITDVFEPILTAEAREVTLDALMLARTFDQLAKIPGAQKVLQDMAEQLRMTLEHLGP